jgi:hypothetical protein
VQQISQQLPNLKPVQRPQVEQAPEQPGYSLKPVQRPQVEQAPEQPGYSLKPVQRPQVEQPALESKPIIKSEIKFKFPLKSEYNFKVGETAK